MTLTAVFAPGGCAEGGGEDVAKALRSTVEAAGGNWVATGTRGASSVIILTGALLQSPDLAKQVCLFIAHPLCCFCGFYFKFVYVCVRICFVFEFVYALLYVFTFVYASKFLHFYVYICMYACTCMYIYLYIHA